MYEVKSCNSSSDNYDFIPSDFRFPSDGTTSVEQIIDIDNDNVIISGCDGAVKMKVAPSCLIQPENLDLVLITWHNKTAYICSVLERPKMNSDYKIGNNEACIELRCKSIVFRASDRIDSIANSITQKSDNLTIVSSCINVITKYLQQVVENYSFKSKRSVRNIDGEDITHAINVHTEAQEVAVLHAKINLITSENVTQINGKQILLS